MRLTAAFATLAAVTLTATLAAPLHRVTVPGPRLYVRGGDVSAISLRNDVECLNRLEKRMPINKLKETPEDRAARMARKNASRNDRTQAEMDERNRLRREAYKQSRNPDDAGASAPASAAQAQHLPPAELKLPPLNPAAHASDAQSKLPVMEPPIEQQPLLPNTFRPKTKRAM
ncbi:hypothetical protein EIP91_010301 [Steccherinum ochraceum]|uniref:Uncharacterized protein n=1 Tax=Steccherinum ochraceum TaxID=92696 RepID=A0A4R0RM28_9APHY|nr:hypothetical protein EIP91_010301 [Steccherinum ochraceum]